MGTINCQCKICGEEFDADKGLHLHIRRKHDMLVGEYYTKYYPRYNLLTGKPLGFKSTKEEYFEEDFTEKEEMDIWLELKASTEEAQKWLLKKLDSRIKKKELKFAPSEVEMQTTSMPSIRWFEKYFGSYEEACRHLNIEPLLSTTTDIKPLKSGVKPKIFVDTREQKPLEFENSQIQKLAIGDYTLAGDDYTYTYIDRKSESDFKGTMTQGFERFCREVERVISLESYLYVVIESSISKIEDNNKYQKWGSKTCHYLFHNMREIQHKYPRNIQFVFTGNRKNSQRVIPYLLMYGKTLWNLDVQLFLENKKAI